MEWEVVTNLPAASGTYNFIGKKAGQLPATLSGEAAIADARLVAHDAALAQWGAEDYE